MRLPTRAPTLATAACITALAALFVPPHPAMAAADRSEAVCKPGSTDDRLTPLPLALVGAARQAFQLDMSDDLIRRTTVYRCLNGKPLLCSTGANLACGKANTRRQLPGAISWCRDHPNTDDVPMFATGHDTIYRWRCAGGAPRIAATVAAVDARGFLTRNWKSAVE